MKFFFFLFILCFQILYSQVFELKSLETDIPKIINPLREEYDDIGKLPSIQVGDSIFKGFVLLLKEFKRLNPNTLKNKVIGTWFFINEFGKFDKVYIHFEGQVPQTEKNALINFLNSKIQSIQGSVPIRKFNCGQSLRF